MSEEVLNNRIQLARLIYSMGTFTEQDLIERFRANTNSPYLGGFQSVKDCLVDLRQFGTLRYREGTYSVAGVGENRYA
jgi:hypothetical protein